MIDNTEKQATIVDKTGGSNLTTDARIQGVENKIRQISQLVETIKSGTRQTEDTLRKEIETIKLKQDKFNLLSQPRPSNEIKKTLSNIAPVLKSQSQSLTPENISPGRQTPNIQNMFSLLQGITALPGQQMSSLSGQQMNMQNLLPSLLQGFLGGHIGGRHGIRMPFGGMSFGGGMNIPFGGMHGMGRIPSFGGFPRIPGMTNRRREESDFGSYGRTSPETYEENKPNGQVATPLPSEKPSIGGYEEKGRTSLVNPPPIPKEKQSQVQKQLQGKAGIVQSVTNELRAQGMSDNGIRAVLANMKDESGFNPTLRHADQRNFGGEAHYAHGLVQAGGEEWNKYDAWLKEKNPGANWKDPALQARFLGENLKKNYPNVWHKLNTGTAKEGAQAFVSGYEKPAEQYKQARLEKYGENVPTIESYGIGKGSNLIKAPSLAGQEPEKKSQQEVTDNIPEMGKPLPDQKNRPYHYGGQLTVGEHVFPYGTGGANRGSAPYGTFPIRGLSTYGYQAGNAFDTGNKGRLISDPKYPNEPRAGILLHTSSGEDIDHIFTQGCLGIPKSKYPEFKAALLEKIKKEGPQFLTINRDGTASINPHKGEVTQSVQEFTKDNKNANAQPKIMDKLSPEGKTINDISKPSITSKVGKTGKISTESSERKEEYTSKDVVKQLGKYQTKLDDLLKKQEDAQKPIPEKKEQVPLTPPMIPKEQQDIRPGQLKNFAMEEKVPSKAPTSKPEPIISPGDKKNYNQLSPDNLGDFYNKQKPEYHESASVKPKWTDMHIAPSKAGNSRVEATYVKPSTGADSNFDAASTAAAQ